jgi:hypothetical protein
MQTGKHITQFHASGNNVFFSMRRRSMSRAIQCQHLQMYWKPMPTYAAHIISFSRASRHLLLTRITLPAHEPPARGAAGHASHFDVRTAGCAWSREVKTMQSKKKYITPIMQ